MLRKGDSKRLAWKALPHWAVKGQVQLIWWVDTPMFFFRGPTTPKAPTYPTRKHFLGRTALFSTHCGPFLGSLTGVWFMFPNSPLFLFNSILNECFTPSKEHSGNMGNSSRPTLGWKAQSDLPIPDLSFSIDRRSASMWGACRVLIKSCQHAKPLPFIWTSQFYNDAGVDQKDLEHT